MKVKESFELIKDKSGRQVYNISPVNRNTLTAFEVDDDDKHHLEVLARGYAKAHGGGNLVFDNIKDCVVVRLPEYPLPGFVTKDGYAAINLSVLPSQYVSDYGAPDIYSMFLYAIVLNKFISKKPFDKDIDIHISNFYISAFMKFFSKKHGLQGSYQYLIPNMQFLIGIYVCVSIMGQELTPTLINKIATRYFATSAKDLDLDFDFSTTIGFLKALRKNNIIQISENTFSQTIINSSGLTSIPAYEDGYRLFATLVASSISGGSIFSSFFKKINKGLYDKMVFMALQNMRKS